MDAPRERIDDLERSIKREFGGSLIALYLYGSVPLGGFVEGKSDIDLLAVTATDVTNTQLPALAEMHDAFSGSSGIHVGSATGMRPQTSRIRASRESRRRKPLER